LIVIVDLAGTPGIALMEVFAATGAALAARHDVGNAPPSLVLPRPCPAGASPRAQACTRRGSIGLTPGYVLPDARCTRR
jgi:hypothetical protein